VDDDAEVTEFLSSTVSEPPMLGDNSVAEDSVSPFQALSDYKIIALSILVFNL